MNQRKTSNRPSKLSNNEKRPSQPTIRRRMRQRPTEISWRQSAYDIIFEADTSAGRWFDIGLLIAILASITVIALETVPEYQNDETWMRRLTIAERALTGLFTVEYALRLWCTRHPLRYAFSFWGVIDLLSILPSFAPLVVGESSRSFVILRSIRLLRVFRVMKLWRMMSDAEELSSAIWRSRNKVVVFLSVLLVAVTISGTLMYHVEAVLPNANSTDQTGTTSQFTSIPQSMYWAIVTMTTVGYGDVVPKTTPGKLIAAALILLGYSLIIVPTGFVSAELSGNKTDSDRKTLDTEELDSEGLNNEYLDSEELDDLVCQACGSPTHRAQARFCDQCGALL